MKKFGEKTKGKTTGRNIPQKNQIKKNVSEHKNEDSENIVFGRNSVGELLRSPRTVDKIFVQKGEREGSILRLISLAKEAKIPVVEAEKAKLDNMTHSSSHQGIVALTTDFIYCELEDILKEAEDKGESPFIVVIDGINDPRNLGAIIRTADACGVHGIILPKRGACGLTATVFKAAAGACEHAKIARVTNISAAIELLKENNVWVYALDGNSETDIFEADLTGAAALVLGDEGSGVSRLVLDKCDGVLKIPMLGNISSLNVSVAGGVAMYQIVKSRKVR